jgi:hypothetical protein
VDTRPEATTGFIRHQSASPRRANPQNKQMFHQSASQPKSASQQSEIEIE